MTALIRRGKKMAPFQKLERHVLVQTTSSMNHSTDAGSATQLASLLYSMLIVFLLALCLDQLCKSLEGRGQLSRVVGCQFYRIAE